MKKLFLAVVVASTLFLTACSSCLGTTATPGNAAPQGEAPDDTQSMVSILDSLLRAGDAAQFYGVLANVPEKMMEVADTAQIRDYLVELYEYLTAHQAEIDALVENSSDTVTKQELPGLVKFFSDIDQLLAFYGLRQTNVDMADHVTDETSPNGEN